MMQSTASAASFPHIQSSPQHYHQRYHPPFASSVTSTPLPTQLPFPPHQTSLRVDTLTRTYVPPVHPTHRDYGVRQSAIGTTTTTQTKISTPLSTSTSSSFNFEDETDDDAIDVENHLHHLPHFSPQRRYRLRSPGSSAGGEYGNEISTFSTTPSSAGCRGGELGSGSGSFGANDAISQTVERDDIANTDATMNTSFELTHGEHPMMIQKSIRTMQQKEPSANELMANDMMLKQKATANELMLKAAMGVWDMRRQDVGLVMVRLLPAIHDHIES